MLSQTCWRQLKWVGDPPESPRRALNGIGDSGRSPWVRSEPEPEIVRSVDEATPRVSGFGDGVGRSRPEGGRPKSLGGGLGRRWRGKRRRHAAGGSRGSGEGRGARGAAEAGGKRALFSHVRNLSQARKSGRCTLFKRLPELAVGRSRTVLFRAWRGVVAQYSEVK